MDSTRYHRATDLFLEAVDLEPAERTEWLEHACGGDEELVRLVEEMLAADEAATDFLETPASAVAAAEDEPVPETVGPFRIVGVLGRGGMGVVYEAEQESPHRRIAVKVLRSAGFSRSLAARFRYEAELLGRLQHPGIAQVFAAGTGESEADGRPWIAMELIRGVPLVQYVRDRRIERNAAIELAARVADAVHHAHQRGIVHRDLKSANVLVDEAGDPKVLDFGVARAEERDMRATLATTPGAIVGTLQTMSPEQAEASADLDARTDVYSLGALTYELLSGRPSLDLTDSALHVALRRVLEEDPPRLGTLDRELRGDIEVVVAKALEKDRERRYTSAAAFAEDLRRVIRGAPIEARPASTAYLLAKLGRRHRGFAIGAGLALVASIVGLVAFALQAQERARAEKATAQAERTAAAEARASAAIGTYLLEDLLAAPDPRAAGREVRVVDVLDRAATNAGATFADQPDLLARVRSTLGQTFLALDEIELAEANLRSALESQRERLGADDEQTLATECWLIELLTARQMLSEGLPLARASLERGRAALGPDHPTTLRTATNLAVLLTDAGAFSEAEALQRDILARRERTLGLDDTATLLTRENLSVALLAQGQVEESLELRENSLALRRARYGDRDPGTLLAHHHLATSQLLMGRLADPVATLEQIHADVAEVFGDEHHMTTGAMQNLARALTGARRFDDAITLYGEVIARRGGEYGADHPESILAESELVRTLVQAGLRQSAADLADDCVLRYSQTGHDPMQLGMLQFLAGETQIAVGNSERGCVHLRASLETMEGLELPRARELSELARDYLTRYGPPDGD